jgi:hypothetical protein
LLLERSELSLTQAIEQVGGLQTQYAPSGYIGLWTRLRDFRRPALREALEQRRVVQATLMRSTIHMVSAPDFWLFAAGVREGRRAWWSRAHALREDVDMDAVAACIRAALSQGPRRRNDLVEALRGEGFGDVAWTGVGLWLDMVRVPPSGTWERRRADLYGLAEDWVERAEVAEIDGTEHLIRRYLGAFGPAAAGDIAGWAGLTPASIRPALARLDLCSFRDGDGRELLDLPGAPFPDPEVPAPVRFLPTWDATLLVHARRSGILPEEYRPRVFNTKTPHSVPTFLIDGAVAGTWSYDAGRIVTDAFHRLSAAERRELNAEAERLEVFHAG